jgi:hypothetical protein
MLTLTRVQLLSTLCAATLAVVPGRAITAQARTNRVQIAVPDSFPSNAGRALVMRFADPARSDVVIVNRSALSARTLAASMALLRTLRRQVARPPQDMLTLVDGFVEMRNIDAREMAEWERTVGRLRAQPRSKIGNLGTGQWIELPDVLVVH